MVQRSGIYEANYLKINALIFGGFRKKPYLCNVRNEDTKSPDSSTVTALHRGKVYLIATKVAKFI